MYFIKLIKYIIFRKVKIKCTEVEKKNLDESSRFWTTVFYYPIRILINNLTIHTNASKSQLGAFFFARNYNRSIYMVKN